MYWTSAGESPYIAKGSMDGTDWEKLITEDLIHPSGLFLDETTQRLYWADPKKGRVASSNEDGSDIQVGSYMHIIQHGEGFSTMGYVPWKD